jgi:hypothetical protein
MILIQIATALVIGAYVVLSKDAQPKLPNNDHHALCARPPAISASVTLERQAQNSGVTMPLAFDRTTKRARLRRWVGRICTRQRCLSKNNGGSIDHLAIRLARETRARGGSPA